MSTAMLVFLGLCAALVAWGVAIYNSLVALANRYRNAFAQIDVQLKRRYDLIPNLVETAKAYLGHERETLEAVTNARNAAMAGLARAAKDPSDAAAIQTLGTAETALGGALGRLSVAVEAYPDLKANQNMMQLSEELSSTENRVAFARQAFNDAVAAYNTCRQSFPQVLIANRFGHAKDAALLEIDTPRATLQVAPKVSF
ncbi:MAG: LemA family protein [Gammaproteobacteria bacterium]|mgnify:CR=1 FL=1|nr:LemA family protein [Gammaproteobacteria bacterium]MBP6051673.1 LemA family protein [Pseudomonadales bacterium]MBK6584682.1 LemA family protein [Gammaproteobacteria bacterium]MBK7519809.1 LemA family protein [Gammaproteobacteria bacterium]MBK7730946.1 LemA family protein [Gammaproteobacteria bacterium]